MICVKETYAKMRTRKKARVIDKERKGFFFLFFHRCMRIASLVVIAICLGSETVCPLISGFLRLSCESDCEKRETDEIYENKLI